MHAMRLMGKLPKLQRPRAPYDGTSISPPKSGWKVSANGKPSAASIATLPCFSSTSRKTLTRPSVAPSEKPAGSKKPSGADIPGISSHEKEGGLGGASSTLASSSSKLLLSSISGGREQRSCDDGLKGMSANWWSGIVAVRTWKIFAGIRKQEKTGGGF